MDQPAFPPASSASDVVVSIVTTLLSWTMRTV